MAHLLRSTQSLSPLLWQDYPDNNIHGANMGPVWDRQGPGGPHVGPMNFAIWAGICDTADLTYPCLTAQGLIKVYKYV